MALEKTAPESKIEFRVNFQKNPERIQQKGSKAFYNRYDVNDIAVVCTITDGDNLLVQSEEEDGTVTIEDWTQDLVGMTANVMLTDDQFEYLNSEFHEIESTRGATIIATLNGNVEISELTLKKEGEVAAIAIYIEEFKSVEPIVVQRRGQVLKRSLIKKRFSEARIRSDEKRQSAIATTRAARESADLANAKTSTPVIA